MNNSTWQSSTKLEKAHDYPHRAMGNDSGPKITINNTINLLLTAINILLISNHNSFRVLFHKIASVYFIWNIYTVPLAPAHFRSPWWYSAVCLRIELWPCCPHSAIYAFSLSRAGNLRPCGAPVCKMDKIFRRRLCLVVRPSADWVMWT